MEVVDDISDVIVDVMLCGPHEGPGPSTGNENDALYWFFRADNIKDYYNAKNGLASAKLSYPDADWRFLFTQKDPIQVCLDFRNETTWPL